MLATLPQYFVRRHLAVRCQACLPVCQAAWLGTCLLQLPDRGHHKPSCWQASHLAVASVRPTVKGSMPALPGSMQLLVHTADEAWQNPHVLCLLRSHPPGDSLQGC